MTASAFKVSDEQLRDELAADLARGGYVLRDAQPYFDKHLVLSRPGLLARAAQLLAELVPRDVERLAVHGLGCALLGATIAQRLGIALLLGDVRDDGMVEIRGETYRGMRVALVEDVVHTGGRALGGTRALREIGADVATAVCLLDREAGAAQRLADEEVRLHALFAERELLRTTAVLP